MKFKELGTTRAREVIQEAHEYVEDTLDKDSITDDVMSHYENIFIAFYMCKAAGDDIGLTEFLQLSDEFLNEAIVAINYYLNNEVHTEIGRIKEEAVAKYKAKKESKAEKPTTE